MILKSTDIQHAPVYGIIGYPLTHSFSPAYFSKKFAEEHINAQYLSFPLQSIDELPGLIASQPDLRGLNVTIPYKTAVLPFLYEIDEVAEAIGAVNCIAIKDGKLYGYNTDVIGFRESLWPLLLPHHKKALILGTGGASKAVGLALDQLGILFRFVSRSQKDALHYGELVATDIQDHQVIINTTPVGMYPNEDQCPDIPYEHLSPVHLLYDLIYNPAETLFLKKGKAQNADTKNGMEMLTLQAEASWEIWNRWH